MSDAGSRFAQLAESGPLLIAVAVAALAGLVSFLSPCILPLVPGYIAYVTGVSGNEARPKNAPAENWMASRRQVVWGSLGFIAGFSLVFVILNVTFTAISRLLITNSRLVEIVGGILIVVLGIGYIGLIPILQREVRINRLPRAGVAASPLLGIVFALSWTPCVSPTLGAVIGLSTVDGSTTRAVILAASYCAGLGLPFLAVGLGVRRVLSITALVRRHNGWISVLGGVLLILVGFALISGAWSHFVIWLKVSVGSGEILI